VEILITSMKDFMRWKQ